MAKLQITPSRFLIACVALYGVHRVYKGAQRRRLGAAAPSTALPASSPQPIVLPAASQPAVHPQSGSVFTNPVDPVDWRDAGTPDRIVGAIQDALRLDGEHINSSKDLAYAAGARLWPGLSIHPSGLATVQEQVRKLVRWNDAPDTDENHEACVRMAARADRVLAQALEMYDGSIPSTVIQDTVTASIFPERAWPPEATDPDWAQDVWSRVGRMVDGALKNQGRLPVDPSSAEVPARDVPEDSASEPETETDAASEPETETDATSEPESTPKPDQEAAGA